MLSNEQTHRNDKESAQQMPEKSATENLEIVAQQQTDPAILIQRAKLDPTSLTPGDVMQLQRMVGNQAVGRLLAQTAQHQTNQKMSLVRRAYEPGSRGRQELIAPELTHVLQQNGGGAVGESDLHGGQTIRRKIKISGSEVGPEASEEEEVRKAVSDPYLREYETKGEMLSHLVKKDRVAVGLNRSRALWYRIPELGIGEFFVFGESHKGVTARHLREASNIKAPIVYEAKAGGLWNEDAVEKIAEERKDAGMESDAAKLLNGLQDMGLKSLWRACDTSPPVKGGSGEAASATAPEPKAEIGKREVVDGTYRLVVSDGEGGKKFWDDESEKQTRKRRDSGVEWSGSAEMSSALRELWPELVKKAAKKDVQIASDKWPDDAAAKAYDEWWKVQNKDGLVYGTLKDLHDLAMRKPRYFKSAKKGFDEDANKALVTPMVNALLVLVRSDLAKLGERQKASGVSPDVAMKPQLGSGSDPVDKEMSFKIRNEFMFESIRKARGKGYAFAALGAGHSKDIAERLKAEGIRYIGKEEFYGELSVNALDEETIQGEKAEDEHGKAPGQGGK